MAREQLEQGELGPGEVHGLAAEAHLLAHEVDLEVVDAHDRRHRRRVRAPAAASARTRASSSSVSNGLVT